MLQHFKLGTWGGFDTSDSGLVKSLKQLRTINNRIIDIEELSFYLNDTSVIVNKIYEDSILEQLERILKKLASHQFHLTKGMTEVPYEIFVPVFEEIFLDEEAILQERKAGYNSKLDYFKFWGLYFYSEEDAVIYDVKKKAIISGNLQTFNI